ncbi:MAG: sulfite exporter TauE/SafE family protein [Sphaerochaetaceae bacterium]|nr:sulfite exporter TauE/SafE family protein [Spirochaetales bacterium]MDY5499999.1 sulfite exporter TauE/SafE family protein [Sphaerochaetaceae bacterium]
MIPWHLISVAFVGAMVPAVTGFGAPILMMAFFPHWMPYSESIALVHAIAMAGVVTLVVRYHASINWKVLWPLAIPSLLIGAIATLLSISLKSALMTRLLGMFLILTSLFFLFLQGRMTIQAKARNGVLAGLASGICNGLFGISAPPAALYLMNGLGQKEAYLATLQTFFLLSNVESMAMRFAYGAYQNLSWNLLFLGWAAILLGTLCGNLFFRHLSFSLLRPLVYIFVAIAGLWSVIAG